MMMRIRTKRSGFLFCFIAPLLLASVLADKDAKRLYDDLLSNYDKYAQSGKADMCPLLLQPNVSNS